MSLSNENNPSLAMIALGSISADVEMPGLVCPKNMKIVGVSLLNGAAIAASDTNYVMISLKTAADVVVAEIDSRAAHENGIAANTKEALNLVAAQAEQDADTVLKVVYDEEGTVAMTDAVLVIHWHAK